MASNITSGMSYRNAAERMKRGRSDTPPFVGQTRIERRGDVIRVILRGTIIARLTPNAVQIFTGGYHTTTTKRYINGVLASAGIAAFVTQRDFQWYYIIDGDRSNPVIYTDGVEFATNA